VKCRSHAVIKRAVGERCQRLPLAFVIEEDILSTCCNKDDVIYKKFEQSSRDA